MNKSQLIEALATAQGLTAKKAEAVVNTIFDTIADALTRGERVEIRGLCSLKVKQYKGYSGRNPKTGEIVTVGEKKMPFCKIGRELKARVDAGQK